MDVILIGTPNFAGKVAERLSNSYFIEIEEKIFPDGEVCPRLKLSDQTPLSGSHAVIAIQLALNQPKNQYLISLLWTIYNVRRHKPAKISCIMPYHLYSRQDRESREGEPLSCRYLALTLEAAGIDKFLTINSHVYRKTDINQFFSTPIASELSAFSILGNELKSRVASHQQAVCLSPDEGALFLAKETAKAMRTPFSAAIQKQRDLDSGEISQHLPEVPFEINNRSIVIVDDIVSSGKTMAGAAQIVKKMGAKEVIFAYVHAVHSTEGFLTLKKENPSLILATDTIKTDFDGLTTVSIVPLISSWIKENF